MHDIMIDLETLGVTPGCAIRSIGACVFDINPQDGHNGVGGTFYANITRDSCERAGLFIDPATDKWWSEQSEDARMALEIPEPLDLQAVLFYFAEWLKREEQTQREQSAEGAKGFRVWSHGAAFDLSILRVAAHRLGIEMPWHFREERDTRTLFMVANHISSEMFERAKSIKLGTYHHALDDAFTQVAQVQECWKLLNTMVIRQV